LRKFLWQAGLGNFRVAKIVPAEYEKFLIWLFRGMQISFLLRVSARDARSVPLKNFHRQKPCQRAKTVPDHEKIS